MSLEDLRAALVGQMKNRAMMYYYIYKEASEVVGPEKAAEILKRAIYKRGLDVGKMLSGFAPDNLEGLRDAFMEKVVPADGSMFVCNFGDAQLEKFTFDPDGKVASHVVVAKGQGMKSCDGMKVHPKTGDVYIADFLANAVHKVDPKTGKVTTLAQNGDTDGAGGTLDQPSEPCIRGKKLYVANIDLALAGNTYDAPHTISVFVLDD